MTNNKINNVAECKLPVDILDDQHFNAIKQGQSIYSGKSIAVKADIIAYATKKFINEKMHDNFAFYKKFLKLIEQAIDAFKSYEITDFEYLKRASDIRDFVVYKKHEDVPGSIADNNEACAYYNLIKQYLMKYETEVEKIESVSANTSLAIYHIIEKHWNADLWIDHNTKKSICNDIDDLFFDKIKEEHNIALSFKDMDEIIEKTIQIVNITRHTILKALHAN